MMSEPVENYNMEKREKGDIDPKLKDGEFFEDYVKKIDETAPYGKDPNGIAHLFPMGKYVNDSAWREEMGYRSDWTKIRTTGIGTKLYITVIFALIFFLPIMLGLPLVYLIYSGSIEMFFVSLYQEMFTYLPLIFIGLVLTKLIGYTHKRIDEIMKPYGKEHNSVKLLFCNDLEYLKFSKRLLNKIMSLKWVYLGSIFFVIYQIIGLITVIDINSWKASYLTPIPDWSRFLIIPANIGIGLVIFLIATFLFAIIYGLFKMGDLGSDRTILSVTRYSDTIKSITDMLGDAQLKKIKLSESTKKFDATGKSFYEFQRGNRKIGELLFNITTYLILSGIIIGLIFWISEAFYIVPEDLELYSMSFSIGIAIFVVLSFGLFFFPQWRIHKFLRKMKYSLIDSFTSLVSRLEYIYFEAIIHPDILIMIDEKWKSRKILLEDIKVIRVVVEKIKSYGTWSYDFPEVMKMVFVSLSTIIPIILSIFPL